VHRDLRLPRRAGARVRDRPGHRAQLTNILRDVEEDAARGRIYLPQEDLRAFGIDEQELLAGGRRSPAMLRLLRFEAQRARLHYLRARAAIAPAERSRLFVAEIMGDIYYALLEELEARRFPAGQRVALSTPRKAALALRRFAASHLPLPA
jgi:phytoene synthase